MFAAKDFEHEQGWVGTVASIFSFYDPQGFCDTRPVNQPRYVV